MYDHAASFLTRKSFTKMTYTAHHAHANMTASLGCNNPEEHMHNFSKFSKFINWLINLSICRGTVNSSPDWSHILLLCLLAPTSPHKLNHWLYMPKHVLCYFLANSKFSHNSRSDKCKLLASFLCQNIPCSNYHWRCHFHPSSASF